MCFTQGGERSSELLLYVADVSPYLRPCFRGQHVLCRDTGSGSCKALCHKPQFCCSHAVSGWCFTCCRWLPPMQHDDREGEGADKWVSRGRGRGAFPRGRGRFMFRKSSTSPKWAHDKFSGEEGEIEDDESGAENREEKDALQTTAE